MAEPVGVAVGLISLTVQVVDGTKRLRDAYRCSKLVPQHLDAVRKEAEFLHHIAGSICNSDVSNLRDDLVEIHCTASIEKVIAELDRLTNKITKMNSSKGLRLPAQKLSLIGGCQNELNRLEKLVYTAKLNLIIALGCCRTLQEISSAPESLTGTEQNDATSSLMRRSHGHTITTPWKISKCTERGCRCRCHTEGSVNGRFWGLRYTPLSMILGHCDSDRCNGRHYKVAFRVAFSRFGLNWAVALAFNMQNEAGNYSFNFSLRPQHIVRFTSDGFLTLFNIRNSLVSLDDGISSLRKLYRHDPHMIHHVDPNGDGYVKKSLRDVAYNPECVMPLLRLFVQEFRITQGLDDTGLIYDCLQWRETGTNIAIFKELFNLGFDPTGLESPRLERWRRFSPSRLLSWDISTKDPFFLDLLHEFMEFDPSFGDSSEIQYEILRNPSKVGQRLLDSRFQLDLTPNFLGQTPLHLAIRKADLIPALINAGHPIDPVDAFGLTPLMYAAGLGLVGPAKELISAGADYSFKDRTYGGDFMSFAFAQYHFDFILELIRHLQSTYPHDAMRIGQTYSEWTLIQLIAAPGRLWKPSNDFIEALVGIVDNISFKFDDPRQPPKVHNNHLLHFRWRLNDVQTFMKYGFDALNHKNSMGHTALMYAASCGHSALTQYFIDMGANIDDQDMNGMSALAHALDGWSRFSSPFGYSDGVSHLEAASILIKAGADLNSRDSCDCGCSLSGCTPISALPAGFPVERYSWMPMFTTVQWLNLLQDCGRIDDMKVQMIALIRRVKFARLGMMHTCGDMRMEYANVSHYYRVRRQFSAHKLLTEDELVQIEARQMDKIQQLNLECQDMDKFDFETLRHIWMEQVFKYYLSVLQDLRIPPWKNVLNVWYSGITKGTPLRRQLRPLERSASPVTVTVDDREDCIKIKHLRSDFYRKEEEAPLLDSIAHIVNIERLFLEIKAGSGINLSDRNAWYRRHLSWTLEFLDVFEVPWLYLRTGIQKHLEDLVSTHILDEKDSSAIMSHFLKGRAKVLEDRKFTEGSIASKTALIT